MVLPRRTQNFEIEKFGSAEAKPYIPLAYIWFCLGGPKILKIEKFGSAEAKPYILLAYLWFCFGGPKISR